MADSIAEELVPRTAPGDGGWQGSTPVTPALSRESARGCLYLSGDAKPWLECGRPIARRSYCAYHARLTYVRMPAREVA